MFLLVNIRLAFLFESLLEREKKIRRVIAVLSITVMFRKIRHSPFSFKTRLAKHFIKFYWNKQTNKVFDNQKNNIYCFIALFSHPLQAQGNITAIYVKNREK